MDSQVGNEYLYQQGDLLFLRVEQVPGDASEVAASKHQNILAYGEATDHRHQVFGEIKLFQTPGGEEFMAAPKRIEVKHLKAAKFVEGINHKSVTLEDGIYQVLHVRERDHLEEVTRTVYD